MHSPFRLAGVVIAVLIATPCSAATMVATFSGTFANDSVDDLGLFGAPGANVVGLSYTETFVYNPDLGQKMAVPFGFAQEGSQAGDVPIYSVDFVAGGREFKFTPEQGQISVQAYPTLVNYYTIGAGLQVDPLNPLAADYYSVSTQMDVWGPNVPLALNDPFGSSVERPGASSAEALSVERGFGASTEVTMAYLHLTDYSVSAVPEPATWALLVSDFGATGFALRRRKALQTRTP